MNDVTLAGAFGHRFFEQSFGQCVLPPVKSGLYQKQTLGVQDSFTDPFQTLLNPVGVQRTRSSEMRTEWLPSLPAQNPFSQMRYEDIRTFTVVDTPLSPRGKHPLYCTNQI